MVRLLDLPMELLLLIMKRLDFHDTLQLCATNKGMHSTFKPYLLLAILKLNPSPVRDYAIDHISYILLCHALCEIYKRAHLPMEMMEDLVRRRKASFGYLPSSQLIFDAVDAAGYGLSYGYLPSTQLILGAINKGQKHLARYIPSVEEIFKSVIGATPNHRINYLFNNGGSPHSYPGGINQLLNEIMYQKKGMSLEGVCVLLKHGADLGRVIHLHNYLMGMFTRSQYISKYALILMASGADVKKSMLDINIILERSFLMYGPCEVVDFLIGQGADITKTPKGKDELLKEVFLERGYCVSFSFLVSLGAEIDLDWMHAELANEFLKHGTSRRFHLILSYPGVDLLRVPGGIDSLLEFEIQHCGLCTNVRLLLDYGAGLANSPTIGELLEPVFWDVILKPKDVFTVFAYLNKIRGWKFGEKVLSRCIGDILREHGPSQRMENVLRGMWIPITKGKKRASPFERLFLGAQKARSSSNRPAQHRKGDARPRLRPLRYGSVLGSLWARPAYHTPFFF